MKNPSHPLLTLLFVWPSLALANNNFPTISQLAASRAEFSGSSATFLADYADFIQSGSSTFELVYLYSRILTFENELKLSPDPEEGRFQVVSELKLEYQNAPDLVSYAQASFLLAYFATGSGYQDIFDMLSKNPLMPVARIFAARAIQEIIPYAYPLLANDGLFWLEDPVTKVLQQYIFTVGEFGPEASFLLPRLYQLATNLDSNIAGESLVAIAKIEQGNGTKTASSTNVPAVKVQIFRSVDAAPAAKAQLQDNATNPRPLNSFQPNVKLYPVSNLPGQEAKVSATGHPSTTQANLHAPRSGSPTPSAGHQATANTSVPAKSAPLSGKMGPPRVVIWVVKQAMKQTYHHPIAALAILLFAWEWFVRFIHLKELFHYLGRIWQKCKPVLYRLGLALCKLTAPEREPINFDI